MEIALATVAVSSLIDGADAQKEQQIRGAINIYFEEINSDRELVKKLPDEFATLVTIAQALTSDRNIPAAELNRFINSLITSQAINLNSPWLYWTPTQTLRDQASVLLKLLNQQKLTDESSRQNRLFYTS